MHDAAPIPPSHQSAQQLFRLGKGRGRGACVEDTGGVVAARGEEQRRLVAVGRSWESVDQWGGMTGRGQSMLPMKNDRETPEWISKRTESQSSLLQHHAYPSVSAHLWMTVATGLPFCITVASHGVVSVCGSRWPCRQ